MLIMWFGKQFYCLTAFIVTEVSSVALFGITLIAQHVHNTGQTAFMTPKAMVIGAYTAMIGVIIGGVVQVLQLIMNAKNQKLEAAFHEKEIKDAADKEVLAAKAELLRQQVVLLTGWQTTLLNQKPGEPPGTQPTFFPDPATATPQAMEQAKTLPLVSTPLTDAKVIPVIPVGTADPILSGSGILRGLGTQTAMKENTEAVKANTEAVKEVSQKM
jgi:hypothetical protein